MDGESSKKLHPSASNGAASIAASDCDDRLTYVGHATTLLRLGDCSLLTDPLLRGRLGPLRRQVPAVDADLLAEADAVLISHPHRDHLDLPSLRRIVPDTPVLVPRGVGHLASGAGAKRVIELGDGETVAVDGLTVTAVPAVHDGRRDPWTQPVKPLGFVIERSGRRVYFAGDTDVFDEMSELRPLELALLPVWGWGPTLGSGHLDPAGAARALGLLRPRIAIPIHWGTIYPLGLRRVHREPLTEPPLAFARYAAKLAPEVDVRVLQPGEETAL
jgi:L-ascorbate metabolism protein UlaG (beta-lactamase superfamily)